MKPNKFIHLALTASMALSLFTACTPGSTPVATGKPDTTTPTTGVTTPATGTTTPATGSTTPAVNTPAATSAALSSSLQAALVEVHDDEAIYADAASVSSDSGFSVKVLGMRAPGEGMVAATGLMGPRDGAKIPPVARKRMALAKEKAQAARERAKNNLKVKKENLNAFKAQMKESGAVTVNDDGTITIDQAKFKAAVKAAVEKKKADIEARLAKVKDKLQATKEVAKDKADKLRRKNNVVRTSDKTSVTNADGSVTDTVKVSFENTKTGLTRETFLSRTTKDNKLVSQDFKLEAKAKNFTRSVTRTMVVNADGTRTVTVNAITTWTDGRKREVNRQHVIAADGSATGTGTITFTNKQGETKTHTLTMGVSASGETTTTATSDDASQTSVTVEEQASANPASEPETTVTVEAPAQETTAVSVSVEAETDAEASDEDEAAAEETPAAEASTAPTTEA